MASKSILEGLSVGRFDRVNKVFLLEGVNNRVKSTVVDYINSHDLDSNEEKKLRGILNDLYFACCSIARCNWYNSVIANSGSELRISLSFDVIVSKGISNENLNVLNKVMQFLSAKGHKVKTYDSWLLIKSFKGIDVYFTYSKGMGTVLLTTNTSSNEGFPGDVIGLPIDTPNCEGTQSGGYIVDMGDKIHDSYKLKVGEWCRFISSDGTKYTVYNVDGKMKVVKNSKSPENVQPTKEILGKITLLVDTSDSTSVSGVATPSCVLGGRNNKRIQAVEESKEKAEEKNKDSKEKENKDSKEKESKSGNEKSESEEEKDTSTESQTGIVVKKNGERVLQCPKCHSESVNIHNNGEIFHCVDCGFEWKTADIDNDGKEDEQEARDEIMVRNDSDNTKVSESFDRNLSNLFKKYCKDNGIDSDSEKKIREILNLLYKVCNGVIDCHFSKPRITKTRKGSYGDSLSISFGTADFTFSVEIGGDGAILAEDLISLVRKKFGKYSCTFKRNRVSIFVNDSACIVLTVGQFNNLIVDVNVLTDM